MKYIINADDFGRTKTVNEAIVYGFNNGYLDRTTIMVNMPYYEEAAKLSDLYGFKGRVGLHINLTSGVPLTDEIRKFDCFCNQDGRFNGRIFSDKQLQLYIPSNARSALKKEIETQIDSFLSHGFSCRHADSHGHVHTFPSLTRLIIHVLRNKSFESLRISLNVSVRPGLKLLAKQHTNRIINRFNLNKVDYFGPFSEVSNSKIISQTNGLTEIMLHPNVFDGDMQIGQGLHYCDINSQFRS